MKKLAIILLVAIFFVPAAKSQFTKIGGGLDFSSGYLFHNMNFDYNKSGYFALSLKGIYEINLPVHISGNISYFYPHLTKMADTKITVSTMMFDINGHYVFNSLDKFEFYGLAGLDVLLAWKRDKYTGSETFKESDNAFGLNIGAGSYMKITDQFDLFLEAKYIVSKYDQFMLNAGILINIDWMIKHENTVM
jgi:opacity protein-like surface antigen